MKKYFQFFLLSLLLCWSALAFAQEQKNRTFSTPEQIKADIEAVNCNDKERLNSVKALFERAGVPAAEITVEKIRGVENVVIHKAGKSTDEKIVVGAHYDKAGNGSCGAVDNWTGVVTVAHIYKTLKELNFNKSVTFVAFGREEEGLIGSKAMAKEIKKETLNQYCAMINIDSLGMNTPQVLSNVSSKKMEALAKDLAQRLSIPLQPVSIHNASSDSDSFMDRKIPAITVCAIPQDWTKVFHTHNDQVDKINVNSVYMGYRLALALVATVDEKECGAFR